ncbi:vWA domain-containing protein [Catelliglobosispora koreensis]|uniref:vWA domain-containing protein n=1 Tax=Catelliglobosispora koreensis TaxID=129052 RepID=UPI000370C6B5|nr:von Willebrand factor type A domain-containing protein [Catelliglobosispora koreensis]
MRKPLALVAVTLALVVAGCSANKGTSNDASPQKPDGNRNLIDTKEDNTSTFALDVDTASYTYAAQQITNGGYPDPSQIRPEEFINYFEQSYREPSGDGFAVHVDAAKFPSGHAQSSNSRLLRVGLQTRGEEGEERLDANLTFVIDVSGSMAERGRLDLVQDALHYLVDQLRPTDAVAIVTFNDRARIAREMTRVSNKERLHTAIDSLSAGGSTNLGEGIVTAYQLARDSFRQGATNRVILLSDGLANTGTTSSDALLSKIRGEADKEISLLGVGVGSEYGDELMEQLADKGDGFVVYISERQQARDLFVKKLPATLAIRAYDAKAQVIFNRSTVDSYQLIGYENRLIADKEFRDNRVDGGEVGPGHSVTALYVVKLREGAQGQVAQVRVRWLDPKDRSADEKSVSIKADEFGDSFNSTDATFKLTYVAAFFAESLRRKPSAPLSQLLEIAREAEPELDNAAVRQLIELIDKMQRRG